MRIYYFIPLFLIFFCSCCPEHKDIYFLPESGLYIQLSDKIDYITLSFSDNLEVFSNGSIEYIDYIQIPVLSYIPVSYYTIYFSKEKLDTLWYKPGPSNPVIINSVDIPIKTIPGFFPNQTLKLFPLQEFYSLQVFWDGKKYSLHLQNNAGEILLIN